MSLVGTNMRRTGSGSSFPTSAAPRPRSASETTSMGFAAACLMLRNEAYRGVLIPSWMVSTAGTEFRPLAEGRLEFARNTAVQRRGKGQLGHHGRVRPIEECRWRCRWMRTIDPGLNAREQQGSGASRFAAAASTRATAMGSEPRWHRPRCEPHGPHPSPSTFSGPHPPPRSHRDGHDGRRPADASLILTASSSEKSSIR